MVEKSSKKSGNPPKISPQRPARVDAGVPVKGPKVWSGLRTGLPGRSTIGPERTSYIFCSETIFGPEKPIPPRIFTQIWSGFLIRPPHLLSGVLPQKRGTMPPVTMGFLIPRRLDPASTRFSHVHVDIQPKRASSGDPGACTSMPARPGYHQDGNGMRCGQEQTPCV
jgi:hypothetical protein